MDIAMGLEDPRTTFRQKLDGLREELAQPIGSDTVSPLLEGLDNEAMRIVRHAFEEAERLAPSLEAENRSLDEASNGRMFAELYAGYARFVPGLGWKIFDFERGKWIDDPDRVFVSRLALFVGQLRRARMPYSSAPQKDLTAFIRASLSAPGVRHLLELAASEPELIASRSDFDRDPDTALDASGNVIDLRTGAIRRARAEDMLTKSLTVTVDPEAQCPVFERFICEAMMGLEEDVHFLRRLSGYGITGRTSEQKIVFFIGPGSNGKGSFTNAYTSILGDYAAAADAELLAPTRTRSPEYQLAELEGKRFVIVRETRRGAALDEALVKSLTGQDLITARSPYQRPFSYRPQFTPVMETNHAPRVAGREHATWRRIVRVPWEFTVTEDRKDPLLGEKLLAEGPGILNWILQGAREWYASGLGTTARTSAALSEYREETDTLADFLAGYDTGEGLLAPSGELYTRYRAWAQESGLSAFSAPRFKEAMGERGFEYRRTGSARYYLGISLNPPRPSAGPSCKTCLLLSSCAPSAPDSSLCADYKAASL